MNRSRSGLIVVLVVLSVSISIVPSQAADYSKVGIRRGDWAVYSIAMTDHPPGMEGRLEVKSVIETKVILNFTIFNADGSVYNTYLISGNVSRGTNVAMFLIAPRLAVGDPIYPNATSSIDRVIFDYVAGGVGRTVNHATIETLIERTYDQYWDWATGIMVYWRMHAPGEVVVMTLNATSLWSPEATLASIVIAVIVVSVVAAVAAIDIHRRRQR
jgi:hypothetical protein